jgi:hypothetical protein
MRAARRSRYLFLRDRSYPRRAHLSFLLSPQEQPLIVAAISLGDWLRTQRESTRQQRKLIERLQLALRTLPASAGEVAAEFGFHLHTHNGEGLVYRAWRVSLSGAGLEIYSVYTPDQPIDVSEKMAHELNFWVRPGETSGHNGHYLAEWIEEVRDPSRLRQGAFDFEVYAAYFD